MSNFFINAHINSMNQFNESLKIKKSVHETFIPSKLSCLQWQNRVHISHLCRDMVLQDRRSSVPCKTVKNAILKSVAEGIESCIKKKII